MWNVEDKQILCWDQTRASRWICHAHSWKPLVLTTNVKGFKVLMEFNNYLVIVYYMWCVKLPHRAFL